MRKLKIIIILTIVFGTTIQCSNESSENIIIQELNESNSETKLNENNIAEGSVKYYLDYDLFTGELINENESKDKAHVEVEFNESKPNKMYIIDLYGNTQIWQIGYSKNGKKYTSMEYNESGQSRVKYRIPMGKEYIVLELIKNKDTYKINGINRNILKSENEIQSNFYWFENFDYKLDDFNNEYITGLLNLKSYTHIWEDDLTINSDNILTATSHYYNEKKELTYENTTCYELGMYSYFWYTVMGHKMMIECP